jgi:beta-glucuronidase
VLRPQDNIIRETKRLDGLWDFVVDTEGRGRAESWWRTRLPEAMAIPVPCSFNDVFANRSVHDHVGDVWYQREVHIPRGWEHERIVLRFDAATHRATVWVDDAQVAEHEGGYTPFEADISSLVRPGQPIRLTAVVNNELTWQSLPPGVVEVMADGERRQRQYHDFFNYAGLHRSVWLYKTPALHIADITVVTDLNGGSGIVHCDVRVNGPGTARVHLELVDAEREVVATADGEDAAISVTEPHLWEPGHGYLYELEVDLLDEESALVDRYQIPVGIRTVKIDGTRFLINDRPFHFKGFGKHEDLNVNGRGHADAAMVLDFALLQWIGANSFRTSHYPYAEEALDLADRLGIVVIDETSAVGLNLGLGGGFFLGGPRETFSEETIGSATQAVHAQAIEELITRDKNHPCVVLWSLANEPESHSDKARIYFTPLFAAARTADPTRPVGFVNMMLAKPNDCTVTELADVIMINRYYGWYVETGDLATAERGWEQELSEWAEQNKPILVTEYGADAMPGLHTLDGAVWSEEYQVAMLETAHRVFDRIDAVVGEHVWNFADFATGPSVMRVDGNKKGVFTRDRRPKAAAHYLRNRWLTAGPARLTTG